MANRSTIVMLVLIAALSIACLALIVALVSKGGDHDDLDAGSPLGSAQNKDKTAEKKAKKPRYSFHPWESKPRLAKSVYPLHYDLYLHPNLETDKFTGRVDITVNSSDPRSHFRLHTKQLDIQNSKIYKDKKAAGNEIDVMEAFEYVDNEYWVLKTNGNVEPGTYILSMEFSGNLTGSIVGFYKSVYKKADGTVVPIATSKFQPTDARKAFPCFDEPSFKSTFTISLIRPTKGYIGLSNMPVDKEIPNSPTTGLTEVKFQKSVPMVSYLVCFIVCDFSYQEKNTKLHNTKFRVYSTPTQNTRLEYAVDIGANITDYFEDYFGIAYPLPKQDMIAIPDFSSGAMEHWGLITYRESNLLYDEKESSSYNKQRVATVISHELAHQWFGNLVTVSWWNDLWLNEGFASYIEYKGVKNYHSDWDMEGQFLKLDLHYVMILDATVNSHPIIQAVEHPDEINSVFDSISYSKGASILRMLESFMGPEDFRIGISKFLTKFKYANAVTQDLWDVLEEVSTERLKISSIMDTWTRQMGYPVIKVEKVSDERYRLTQERYLTDPTAKDEGERSPFGYKWDVPITYFTDLQPKNVERNWLMRDDGFLEVNVPRGSKWIKVNSDQYGYYRVNYPREQWLEFSQILLTNHKQMTTMDRSHLLNDAFSLAESGHLDYSIPMAMIQYLKNEQDFVPWSAAVSVLDKLADKLEGTEAYPNFRKYILSLVVPHVERMGWRDDGSHTQRRLRGLLLSVACRLGHRDSLDSAGRLFRDLIGRDTYVPANLRTSVYKYGMANAGDFDSWEKLLEKYANEQNAQEKRKIIAGITNVKQPWILEHFLQVSKNESIVRSQDYIWAVVGVSRNSIGNSIAWNFIREEWPYLVERFSIGNRYLGRLPKYVSELFSSQFKLDEMLAFFEQYPEAGAGKLPRKQALERVRNNIKWLKDHRDVITQWLRKNAPR